MRSRSPSACCRAFLGRGASGSATQPSTGSSPSRRREPSLTVTDVDRAISGIEEASGSGSTSRRKQILAELLGPRDRPRGRISAAQLLTGGLRQGALAGVMVDAVAKAASVPAGLARRAMMLSGDLTQTAAIARAGGEQDYGRSGLRSSARSCRCSPLPRPASRTHSRGSIARRSSSSSTGFESRSIGALTRCGSTRATSTRSPSRCPESSSPCAACR